MARQRFNDLGFGTRAAESRGRLLNRDGSFNIRRKGLSFFRWFSGYHYLIGIPWWKFNFFIIAAFIGMNALFAAAYCLIGTKNLSGIDGLTPFFTYLESFFFSTQTFTTVGYGRVAPISYWANTLSAFESLSGLVFFAFVTGLVYGRFSRPVARILFSRHALVAPYQEVTGFMFRVANERKNQLIDVEAVLTMVRAENDGKGGKVRRFYELDLERQKVSFFHLSWTIVHPVDESSPLFGWTKEQLDESDAEFLIILKGFDDTFSQTVHARTSYKHNEVLYGRKFSGIIGTGPDGITEIDLSRLHEHDAVA